MHVLHVETGRRLYGGAQQVLYITAGLAARGIRNTLVCPPGSGIAAAAAPDVDVVEVPCGGDLDIGFLWRLRRVIRRVAPDLVHCHSRRGADVFGGRAAAGAGVPAIVSRRVDNVESSFIARFRYRPFQRIVAISEVIAAVLRDAGVDEERLVVIRSAVDLAAFAHDPSRDQLQALFRIDSEQLAIASAGQLIERKGHRFLLRAVAGLRDRFPQLRVVIFGQGPEEKALRALSDQLGVADIVQFAGFRADLDGYLGAFDLLVHPALTEGLGVIALKAQAASLPVIAFDAGGLPEIVVNGRSGQLVPPRDVTALTAAIADLLDDRNRRERYASFAREHAHAHFSVDTMVHEHARLYESLLNG
jgi:glycosyltransferase involved in cell wall biosynthesis